MAPEARAGSVADRLGITPSLRAEPPPDLGRDPGSESRLAAAGGQAVLPS